MTTTTPRWLAVGCATVTLSLLGFVAASCGIQQSGTPRSDEERTTVAGATATRAAAPRIARAGHVRLDVLPFSIRDLLGRAFSFIVEYLTTTQPPLFIQSPWDLFGNASIVVTVLFT